MDYGDAWWKVRPPVVEGAETIYDLCGYCGVSRDCHPHAISSMTQDIVCQGLDWRQIGYVGEYGDPRPGKYNGREPYRDPNEPGTMAWAFYPWALPNPLPAIYG